MEEALPRIGKNAMNDAATTAHAEILVQRLGKNLGGYFGETIEIEKVLSELRAEAIRHDWRAEALHVSDGLELLTLCRTSAGATRNVYISTGIHGDEPAGPL